MSAAAAFVSLSPFTLPYTTLNVVTLFLFSVLAVVLKWLDIIVTFIFTLEMAIKIWVRGLILPKGAYLRNNWNILDCVVVVTSILRLESWDDAAVDNDNNITTCIDLRFIFDGPEFHSSISNVYCKPYHGGGRSPGYKPKGVMRPYIFGNSWGI